MEVSGVHQSVAQACVWCNQKSTVLAVLIFQSRQRLPCLRLQRLCGDWTGGYESFCFVQKGIHGIVKTALKKPTNVIVRT